MDFQNGFLTEPVTILSSIRWPIVAVVITAVTAVASVAIARRRRGRLVPVKVRKR